jgi:hypothetical protein
MKPRFAVCIENSEYPASLERFKICRVLPDQEALADGLVRIIDESGEDYLYSERCFIPIDLPQEAERVIMHYVDRNAIA